MDQILKYSCPKCGNKQYEIGEMWTFSSIWAKIFELHTRRFTFLSCQNCKKKIGEVINFMAR
jgi:predicted nucleic-acid-binding Zn-ribbon protein